MCLVFCLSCPVLPFTLGTRCQRNVTLSLSLWDLRLGCIASCAASSSCCFVGPSDSTTFSPLPLYTYVQTSSIQPHGTLEVDLRPTSPLPVLFFYYFLFLYVSSYFRLPLPPGHCPSSNLSVAVRGRCKSRYIPTIRLSPLLSHSLCPQAFL